MKINVLDASFRVHDDLFSGSLARRITRPLAYLSQSAQRIGAGGIPEGLPDSPISELSDLSAAFNQMALQVRELLANRTTLLAGISHDLRTPLARMRLAVEMLPDNSDRKTVERLRRDIEAMDELIGEFLVLSKELRQEIPETLELAPILHALAQDASAHGQAVECAVDAGLKVEACPLALHRVLRNLLDNALRYGNSQLVRIEAARHDDSVEIRALDRGPGIPPQELEKVFRPFYRIESSRNANTGGSGLGLAIVQQLCAVNGWQIALQPRTGGGTMALLMIPAVQAEK